MSIEENIQTQKLFTTLYPFFWQDLRLSGVPKEVFAVIFNFWVNSGNNAVIAPVKTIRAIIGASRSRILDAIRKLEQKGVIIAYRVPGKNTRYGVEIDEEIMRKWYKTYVAPVQHPDHQRSRDTTTTGLKIGRQNKKNNKLKENEEYNNTDYSGWSIPAAE